MNRDFSADVGRRDAYGRLVDEIFGGRPMCSQVPDPPWEILAVFEPDGTCIAGLEVGDLFLVLDGIDTRVTAIRLAGVAPSHRGRGLFRDLMDAALEIGDGCGASVPMLLYTVDETLYARFGFAPLAQHAFLGVPPEVAHGPAARQLGRDDAFGLIDRLGSARVPVSRRCAIRGGLDLLRSNLDDDDLRFAVLGRPETLVIYEHDTTELVIVDIVGATIPTMAEIVGALGVGAARVRTLFPSDRLDWDGAPVRDDTGLMIRGRVPSAMQHPFMLPPTTSF